MEDKLKEESLEGFAHLLGNFRAEKFFVASHNNSKEELNLFNDLLDLQKLDKDNLLDRNDFAALAQSQGTSNNNTISNEIRERAFKVELRLHSEPFIIFSRNNGIAKNPKKKTGAQASHTVPKDSLPDEPQYPENMENYLSLPLREGDNLDFTLQPPTMTTETANFESLGANPNMVPGIRSNQREYPQAASMRQSMQEFTALQENVPFLLGHPSQKSSLKDIDNMNNMGDEKNKEFSIHEISFNKDQFSNSLRTDQDTIRSLQLPKQYEMPEEEEEEEVVPPQRKFREELPLQMPQERYKDIQSEVGLVQQKNSMSDKNLLAKSVQDEPVKRTSSDKEIKGVSGEQFKSGGENKDSNNQSSVSYIISIFYQLVNENKFLKQEMAGVNERVNELIKQKEAETDIICNLQQNLELTMMLLKKRDEDILKLQKRHEELAKYVESHVEQTKRSAQENFIGHSKSHSFLLPQDFEDSDYSREVPMDRSSRRSSSFTNVVHNGRMSKVDQRRQAYPEHQRSQKSFPTHFSEMNSVYDNEMAHESSMEQRRNSSYNLRSQVVPPNFDRKDSAYDTAGEYDSRYGGGDPYNQMYNKVVLGQGKKPVFMNQQQNMPEREEQFVGSKPQNFKGFKRENSAKNWYDKDEQDKIGTKENNRWGQNPNRPSVAVEPANLNNIWIGGMQKQNVDVNRSSDGKFKTKVQNYKKYSEMFKKQKEAVEQGNNFLKEDIKGKIQRK